MREFSKGQFRLRDAPAPLRLVYGGFLVLIALGLLSQLGFQLGRIGVSPAAIAVYYRGSESENVMAFPKTFGQLLEVSHAHAFTMAVVFLILAHLFISTAVSSTVKAWTLGLAFGGTLVDVLAPWGVRYASPALAWLDLAAWVAAALGTWTMVIASGWECLGPRS